MVYISIVIPAYNAAQYIERCLDSIFLQEINDKYYEVIVVDDGSTDNTLGILRIISEKHSNMNIIAQENLGPSAARNRGLDVCKGKYVWFVDSDDYVTEKSLKDLLACIENYDVDIFYFTAKYIDLHGVEHIGSIPNWLTSDIKDGKTILKKNFKMGSSCIAIWNLNYLKMKCMHFNENVMFGEDALFMFLGVSQAKRIKFINQCYYVYVSRDGSLSTIATDDKIKKQKRGDVDIACSLLTVSRGYKRADNELSLILEIQANKILFSIILSLFRNKRRWKRLGINASILEYMKEKDVYPLIGSLNSWKKKIMCFFLNKEYFIN